MPVVSTTCCVRGREVILFISRREEGVDGAGN